MEDLQSTWFWATKTQDSGTEPGSAYKISLNTFSDQTCCSSFLLLRVRRAAVGVCVVWLLPKINLTQWIFASFMVFFLPIFNSNSFFTVNKINNKAQSVVPAKNFTVFSHFQKQNNPSEEQSFGCCLIIRQRHCFFYIKHMETLKTDIHTINAVYRNLPSPTCHLEDRVSDKEHSALH